MTPFRFQIDYNDETEPDIVYLNMIDRKSSQLIQKLRMSWTEYQNIMDRDMSIFRNLMSPEDFSDFVMMFQESIIGISKLRKDNGLD